MTIRLPDRLAPTRAEVVVVGSLNVDRVLTVRQLPTPGETVTAIGETTAYGGKGANQAAAAAAVGAQVAFIGVVGDDLGGREGVASLQAAGVEVSCVRIGRAPTGSATIVVDSSGDNMIVVRSGANEELTAIDVRVALESLLLEHSVVLASLEVPLEAIEAAASVAQEIGARFVLNPAPARVLNSSLLASCDVLVPNEQEVLNLGRSVPAILASGVGAVVITRGGEGAEVFVGREEPRLVPAPAVAVRDTTGAGDVFAAALAVALQEGAALLAACRFAVAAGSLATTGLGARGSLPSRFSIEEMLTEKGLY